MRWLLTLILREMQSSQPTDHKQNIYNKISPNLASHKHANKEKTNHYKM